MVVQLMPHGASHPKVVKARQQNSTVVSESQTDPTRDPGPLDRTAEFLVQCGVGVLPTEDGLKELAVDPG